MRSCCCKWAHSNSWNASLKQLMKINTLWRHRTLSGWLGSRKTGSVWCVMSWTTNLKQSQLLGSSCTTARPEQSASGGLGAIMPSRVKYLCQKKESGWPLRSKSFLKRTTLPRPSKSVTCSNEKKNLFKSVASKWESRLAMSVSMGVTTELLWLLKMRVLREELTCALSYPFTNWTLATRALKYQRLGSLKTTCRTELP